MQPYRHSVNIKAGLFILGIVLVSGLLLYSQSVVDRLRANNKEVVQLYAEIIASTVESESDENLSFIFDKIIKRVQFPLIYSDGKHTPLDWKNLPDGLSVKDARKHQEEMDSQNQPIPLTYMHPETNERIAIGYLHYGDSILIKRLEWLPFLEIGAVTIFILLGFIGFSVIRNSEKRSIWVGMARETAHQLGTPVSALMGWVDRLRESSDPKIITEMDRDIQRLEDVSNRFSKIGSKPTEETVDIMKMLKTVIDYLNQRVRSESIEINIKPKQGNDIVIRGNVTLLSWAFENLIKNGIDSLENAKGSISIEVNFDLTDVVITITDTGKGIPKRDWKNVFRPGFSSKAGGWGLGLSLTQRIIQDIHKGSIRIVNSDKNQGTVFEIKLAVVIKN
ncbi:MAG: HAMP domain-containing histidine kinase [Candidatus Marinimicrobia bacterium]|jgi:signal transduction histidine kinase|nr:HAMP domain-containing histidine kinase [Candidatus Neomarinimicrobiota bacterium]MBT4280471.1 HAMP domain-containing histidine kinase [Candidatus Neomarinimicrobiota bacterium]MBT6929701.1 HAMP domain-containing histidine kinase [Candidatus Neomarinimicrobiota bacterium]